MNRASTVYFFWEGIILYHFDDVILGSSNFYYGKGSSGDVVLPLRTAIEHILLKSSHPGNCPTQGVPG